jgi:hypothetical protein
MAMLSYDNFINNKGEDIVIGYCPVNRQVYNLTINGNSVDRNMSSFDSLVVDLIEAKAELEYFVEEAPLER